MRRYKQIFLYILFAITIPAKALLAQDVTPDTTDTEIDTTVRSELDIRYDSVLAKAALSLGASSYSDAIASYKEASALKPANVYPYKMILYAEDLAFKQKRKDDLNRKAKIRNELNKANNAIAQKSWDTARLLFNEVLTLNPEKTDQDYAKSKIEAIDLELTRIAARIPPKPAPVVIVVPKNRHEARAMRKIAERNAKLPPALISPTTKAETQVPSQAANSVAPSVAKVVVQQKSSTTAAPEKAAAASAVTNQIVQKPTETPAPQKTVIVAPATNQTTQKSIETSVTQKTAAPATNQSVQKPAQTSVTHKVADVAPLTNQAVQKPLQNLPSQKLAASAPAIKDTQPKPTETSLPQATVVTTSPLSDKLSSSPAASSSINLVDSTDNIKLICQDISFIGTNAYIKVLIQNYSETDRFLTDTLQVSLKKNNGSLTKLEQRFISSFPVIAPLGESIFVSFADASIGVDPDDIFILEMRDKTKKTKLALQIPWAVYKQQKNL